ncbi:MAG TPA: hypothetical protein VLT33_00895 [Labilithrix sp.]|nr:hypothetical protein [Labilithrix sp.]
MILSGREIKAIRGALMHHAHIPFVRSNKPALTTDEQRAADLADAKLTKARECLEPNSPRETPGWLDKVLDGQADVSLAPAEMLVVVKLTRAALAELDSDNDLSVLVGPGVGLAALRSAYSKIKDVAHGPS